MLTFGFYIIFFFVFISKMKWNILLLLFFLPYLFARMIMIG